MGAVSELDKHLSMLTGPRGPHQPGEVLEAAESLRKLREQGGDLSPAFAGIRAAIAAWSEYGAGPGMFSDNYTEEEQEREAYGPSIIKRLLTVLTEHALAVGDRSFAAEILTTGQRKVVTEIVHDVAETAGDLSVLVEPLIDDIVRELASPDSEAGRHDLEAEIENLPLWRAPDELRAKYEEYLRRKLELLRG
jgi:hypothetical protein